MTDQYEIEKHQDTSEILMKVLEVEGVEVFKMETDTINKYGSRFVAHMLKENVLCIYIEERRCKRI